MIATGVLSRDGGVGYRGEINTGRHAKTGSWQKRTESRCATREREMRTLLKGLILWRADGVICEKSCNTERKIIYHMMNNENIDNNK